MSGMEYGIFCPLLDYNLRFINLGAINILDQIILCCGGAVLCTAGSFS